MATVRAQAKPTAIMSDTSLARGPGPPVAVLVRVRASGGWSGSVERSCMLGGRNSLTCKA